MKQEEYNELVKRCSIKKDGIYTYKGNFYLCIDKRLYSYVDYFGNIFEVAYGFNVSKGKAESRFKGKEILKSYFKQLKNK